MSESTWIYKWILPNGTVYITTDYHEANEALHSPSHPRIVGCRVHDPLPETEVF